MSIHEPCYPRRTCQEPRGVELAEKEEPHSLIRSQWVIQTAFIILTAADQATFQNFRPLKGQAQGPIEQESAAVNIESHLLHQPRTIFQ